MADLVEIFRSGNSARAKLVHSALTAHGIRSTLVGADMAGLVGAAGFLVPARILVAESTADDARALIAVMDAFTDEDPSERGDPEVCPHCGEAWEPGFDRCWGCSKAP